MFNWKTSSLILIFNISIHFLNNFTINLIFKFLSKFLKIWRLIKMRFYSRVINVFYAYVSYPYISYALYHWKNWLFPLSLKNVDVHRKKVVTSEIWNCVNERGLRMAAQYVADHKAPYLLHGTSYPRFSAGQPITILLSPHLNCTTNKK